MIFGVKEKSIILTQTILAIAKNIPQRLKTGFVVQGHIWLYILRTDFIYVLHQIQFTKVILHIESILK